MDDSNTQQVPGDTPKAPRYWQRSDPGIIVQHIHNETKRPAVTYRVRQFGLRSSRYKDDELLWAQQIVTQLKSSVWQTVWADFTTQRVWELPFSSVEGTCGSAPPTAHYRAREGFTSFVRHKLHKLQDNPQTRSNPSQLLYGMVYNYFNKRDGFTLRDTPVASSLREGAFADASTQILIWAVRVLQHDWEVQRMLYDTARPKPQSLRQLFWHHRQTDTPHLALFALLTTAVAAYQRCHTLYVQSGQQTIPIEKFQGQTLAQVGSRQTRQVLERLLDVPTAETKLKAVRILLAEKKRHRNFEPSLYSNSDLEWAKTVRHPYKRLRRSGQHSHAVKARHVDRHTRRTSRALVKLHTERVYELEKLADELEEMIAYRQQLEPILQDIRLFLLGRPPAFPTLKPAPITGYDKRLSEYEKALDRLGDPFPSSARRSQWESYDPEQLEHFEGLRRAAYLKAAADVERERQKYHPLYFPRAFNPNPYKSRGFVFTVVFYEEEPDEAQRARRYSTRRSQRYRTKYPIKRPRCLTPQMQARKIARDIARGKRYRFALVVAVHGQEANKENPQAGTPRKLPQKLDASIINEQQKRQYYFVDAPYVPFDRSRGHNVMFFPLECKNDADHDGIPTSEVLLTQLVEEQRNAQEALYNGQCRRTPPRQPNYQSRYRAHAPVQLPRHKACRINLAAAALARELPLGLRDIEECIPESILKTARIVSEVQSEYRYSFSLLLPVPVMVPPLRDTVQNTLAVTYDQRTMNFVYAVLSPNGQPIELGTLATPAHVKTTLEQKYRGQPTATTTLVHEVARAIVRLAVGYDGCIVMEDQPGRPTGSRSDNRLAAVMPQAEIIKAVEAKALLAGLPALYTVRGVPRKNACGQCGRDLEAGTVAFSNHKSVTDRKDTPLRVPVYLTMVAVVCNLPGIASIRLAQRTLLGILLGQITFWDDPLIIADNPILTLPQMPITLVRHASDGSVADVVNRFVDAMVAREHASIPSVWQRLYTEGKGHIRTAALYNEQLTYEQVATMEGALGFVAWSPELHESATIVALANAAGHFVVPNETSSAEANQYLRAMLADCPVLLADNPDTSAYPLTGVTWLSFTNWSGTRVEDATARALLQWLLAEYEKIPQLPTCVQIDAATRHIVAQQVKRNRKVKSTLEHSPPRIVRLRVQGVGEDAPHPQLARWLTVYQQQVQYGLPVIERGDLVPVKHDEDEDEDEQSLAWHSCRQCETEIPAAFNAALLVGRVAHQRWMADEDGQAVEGVIGDADGEIQEEDLFLALSPETV